MTTNSLGCEANVIPALFIPPSIRICSKWLALWFCGFCSRPISVFLSYMSWRSWIKIHKDLNCNVKPLLEDLPVLDLENFQSGNNYYATLIDTD